VLTTIREFHTSNERPCPKTHLIGKFGNDVLDVLDSLKESGKITGKRGRNGGFVLADGITLDVTPVTVDAPASDTGEESNEDAVSADDSEVPSLSTDDVQRMSDMMSGAIPMDEDWLRKINPSMFDDAASA